MRFFVFILVLVGGSNLSALADPLCVPAAEVRIESQVQSLFNAEVVSRDGTANYIVAQMEKTGMRLTSAEKRLVLAKIELGGEAERRLLAKEITRALNLVVPSTEIRSRSLIDQLNRYQTLPPADQERTVDAVYEGIRKRMEAANLPGPAATSKDLKSIHFLNQWKSRFTASADETKRQLQRMLRAGANMVSDGMRSASPTLERIRDNAVFNPEFGVEKMIDEYFAQLQNSARPEVNRVMNSWIPDHRMSGLNQ